MYLDTEPIPSRVIRLTKDSLMVMRSRCNVHSEYCVRERSRARALLQLINVVFGVHFIRA